MIAAVDLFSGGGGAALGLHAAGVRCLAHVEIDAHACATLRAARDAGLVVGEVIEGDIRQADLTPHAGVRIKRVAVTATAIRDRCSPGGGRGSFGG